MPQSHADFSRVEPDAFDGEAPLALELIEQFAARQVVEDHVQLAFALEGVRHVSQERMPDLL